MPLPPSPRRRKSTKARLLEAAKENVTTEVIRQQLASAEPALLPRPLARGTQANQQRVKDKFSEWLGPPRNIKVGDQTPLSFERWIDLKLPFPTPAHLKSFFTYWVGGSMGTIADLVSANYIIDQFFILCACFRRANSRVPPEGERSAGLGACIHVAKEMGLQWNSKNIARLDAQSVRALQKCSLDPTWKWRKDERARIRVLAYISLGSQTAARPGALVKPKGESRDDEDNRDGCSYGDFDLWAFKSPGGGPNTIHGHFKPRHGKTVHSRGKCLPLPPATHCIMDSAAVMIFISLYVDGYITPAEFKSWFEPEYCGALDRQKISFPAAW